MPQAQKIAPAVAISAPAPVIDVAKVCAAKLQTEPYEYLVVSGFIRPEWTEKLITGYPEVPKGGSWPLPTVQHGADFAQLIAAMNGPEFRKAVEEKFALDLAGKPTMFTVRGHCRAKDGKIHTDSESKIITVLLYMNPEWANQGGKLRVLRSGDNIEDIAAEVSPTIGTLLIFKRSTKSWHGHLPFEGERRVIQMNWVTEQKYVDLEAKRHWWSSLMKKLGLSY
jgi:SM-20-related protein